MRGIVNKWFDCNLSNRNIRVKCKTNSATDAVTSDNFSVTYGTAQAAAWAHCYLYYSVMTYI